MSRIPGFTAEGALLERTQHHYRTAGVGRSSGSVKPAFSYFGRSSEFSVMERAICCWLKNCPKGELCLSDSDGSCYCWGPPSNGGGPQTPFA